MNTYKGSDHIIGDVELEYSPEGYLRQYKVWADNVVYTYEYSSLSGSLILDRFDVWKEGKQEASYERDINDHWYAVDKSGNKTACDRPEAADRCPPVPVR